MISDEKYSLEVREKAYKETLKDIYNSKLFLTAKYLLGYSDITENTHGLITKVLASQTKRKLIVVPRGSFKSSLGSISYPIWCLNRNPNERILLDSELFTNSSRFLREIKNHLTSEKLIRIYGEYKSNTWNETEIIIKQRTSNHKEASITCSGIGAQKTSQHYDRIIADDLNSPDNSQTKEGRQKVIDHYKYYISLLEPGGTLVVIGTRYAHDDVIGHILQNEIEQKGLLQNR